MIPQRTKIEEIADEYEGFWELANKLAGRDLALYPLEKKELPQDRVTKHLLGMIELYAIRYGDPEQRLRIVDFLERRLFPASTDEVCRLTLSWWKHLRKDILSNEYEEPK